MDEKRCPKCETFKKREAFCKSNSSKDGLQSWCKKCKIKKQQSIESKKYQKKYRQTKITTEDRRRYGRKYDQSDKGKETIRKKDRKYKEKYPEKVKARSAVATAIRLGKLKQQSCHCGEAEVEAHHEDYSKPLDVEWLCKKHHK